MQPGQRDAMRDALAEARSRLIERGSNTLVDFEKDFLDELKRIHFRIGHPPKLLQEDEPGTQEFYAFCIDCDIPIIIPVGGNIVCRMCNSDKWIEIL